MKPPVPIDEVARLEILHQLRILDTLPEKDFDDLALLAANICETPVALVSFIDAERQWFKAKVGTDVQETARDIAFCAHAILQNELFIVPDACLDPRFASNPLVTANPFLRFYAGMPLVTSEGRKVGTICVLDYTPRELTSKQQEALRALGHQVSSLLELRRAKTALEHVIHESNVREEALQASEEFKTRMIECSMDCIKVLDLNGRLLSMNAGGMRVLEICDFTPLHNSLWLDFWQGEARESAGAAVALARKGEVGRFVGFCPTMRGKPMWWDVVVNPIYGSDGKPERLLAVSRDITERRNTETTLRTISEGTASVTGSDFF